MAFNRNYLSWKTLKETIWTDIVTVSIFGSEHARERFRYFSSLHPQFPLIPRKSLGAAMINLRRKLCRLSAKQIERHRKEQSEIGEEAQVFVREDRCGLGH